jgi:hypothetical protein
MNKQINSAFAASFAAAFAKNEWDMKAEDMFIINAAVATPIEYKTEWNNGTGYMNGATSDMELNRQHPVGSVLCARCPQGRVVLIVTTPVGNAVVFQRYSDRTDVIVANIPEGIRIMYETAAHSHLSVEEVRLFLGQPRIEGANYISYVNIGKRLKGLLDLSARIEKGEEIHVA